MVESERIAIVPAGAFGTAMGLLAARNGHNVALYIPRQETLRRIIDTGQNPKLEGVDLPESMMVTGDIEKAMEGRPTVVFAAPSHVAKRFGEMMAKVANGEERHVLSLTKGLHVTTSGDVMVYTDMLRNLNSQFITAAESGPNFAKVVAMGEEKVQTIIASANTTRDFHQATFSTDMFEVITDGDEIGTQAAGAAKNDYALGVGMCEGMGVGEDVLKKLVGKGPAEMAIVGVALGGRRETFDGVAGLGDLKLTCTTGSRNYRAGIRLGAKKIQPSELVKEAIIGGEMVEGVHAAWAIKLLSEKYNLDLPVMGTVAEVLFNGLNVDEAVVRIRKTV